MTVSPATFPADTGSGQRPPAVGVGVRPPLSNRLAVLAAQARTAFGDYVQSRRNARRGFLVVGGLLSEARGSARRGEWGPFLVEAGIGERTATNMIRLHRGGWTGETLEAAGGVRAALDVQAARDRLACEVEEEGQGEAAEALQDSPDAFVAFCASSDSAPAEVAAVVVSGLDDDAGSEGEKAENFSGNAGEAEGEEPRNDGSLKWNPARPSSNEAYTPEWACGPAREALGGFDLDPASCEEANATIRAARFFSIEDDGLAHPWSGKIWLNPPYSGPGGTLIAWIGKLLADVESGAVVEAVALLPAYVETEALQAVLARCDAVCFPSRRIQFERPGLPAMHPPAGSAVAYFGPNPERFREAYADRGEVLPGRWAWRVAA